MHSEDEIFELDFLNIIKSSLLKNGMYRRVGIQEPCDLVNIIATKIWVRNNNAILKNKSSSMKEFYVCDSFVKQGFVDILRQENRNKRMPDKNMLYISYIEELDICDRGNKWILDAGNTCGKLIKKEEYN